ncbi:uncharacterized protein GGS22DRAFT_164230 [Annulohypoxylon maeteangense]|uniref:uncharacterized protein n=1 Tax=Annulohypoxylon maeteangense TaxID=1927788 RepID=UPI002008BD2D|nr:uncharacterized protein GGS22DRAFT_164230 [Annulohypoxylon maeteangense]KAI0884730.1 hypothetical protein GGS22DRAFT_164230 [Annulohypoxylon maeteangense]
MAGPESSRRPKLSLQTKSSPGPSTRSARTLPNVNPRSPTSFNTLSNKYVTAIERSTPIQSTPITAINLLQPLKLQTDPETLKTRQSKTETPFTANLPETPLSANPISPAQQMDIIFPSSMTATPPMSAGPVESSEPSKFAFLHADSKKQAYPYSPAQSRRRVIYAPYGTPAKAPYTRDKSLHSILRNSPLPPQSARSPLTPTRQSRRLQEKASRHVGYVSPLTQTITTEKYIKSHVDLLADDASPYTPSPVVEDSDMLLDLAMAYTGDETRNGGETPGPFEEMRRRMNGLGTDSPILSPSGRGVHKRRRKDKRRKWVWTINPDEEENEGGAMAALRAAAAESSTPRGPAPTSVPILRIPAPIPAKAATPEPVTAVKISVGSIGSGSDTTVDRTDVEMSDADSQLSSRATTPHSVDLNMKTPTALALNTEVSKVEQFGSADSIDPATGMRRDTPIPPDLVSTV